MAIYEYFCSSCKTKFERRRSMSQAAIAEKCAECDTPAERMLSMFAAPRAGDADSMFEVPAAGGGGCCGGGGGCACSSQN